MRILAWRGAICGPLSAPSNYSIKSLDALNKNDITEVKNFVKPPPLVEGVLSGVCLLMGRKESCYTEATTSMTSPKSPHLKK